MAGGYNYYVQVESRLAPGTTAKLQKQYNNIKLNPKATSGMKELNKQTGIFGQSLGSVLKKIAVWSVLTKLLFGTVRAIKDGISAVTDLNTELIELRKVSNATNAELAQTVVQAMKIGEGVARTTTEIVEATASWKRMGFTMQESLNLAEQSAILQNVSSDIKDINSATSTLIATLKGFNLQSSEAGAVVDRLNEVSNNYAVTVGDLSLGITKVSASMAAANNDIDETIALMTSATEVLRNSSRASIALRTISMRSDKNLASIIWKHVIITVLIAGTYPKANYATT